MIDKPAFKRVVFSMHHGAPHDDTLRIVVEFAEIMQMPLLGLYAADPRLMGLAGLPFVREFRPLGGGWRPVDVDQLSREVELAAERLQHRFASAVKDRSIDSTFLVVRNSTSNMIASTSEAGDIVVVTESTNPADRATHQSTVLIEAAFRSSAAVLLLPHRIARRAGAIVAVATEADDPAVKAAAGIAAAFGEKLVLLETDRAADHQSALTDHGGIEYAKVEHLVPNLARLTGAAELCSALAHVTDRLVVMTRGAFDDAVPATVASMRHIPVLIIEPSSRRDRNPEVAVS